MNKMYKFYIGLRQKISDFYDSSESDSAVLIGQYIGQRQGRYLHVNIPSSTLKNDTISKISFYRNTEFLEEHALSEVGLTISIPNKATNFNLLLWSADGKEQARKSLEERGIYICKEASPNYSGLAKTYKKENNQQFFRTALTGNLKFTGCDYTELVNADIESQFIFILHKLDANRVFVEYYKAKFAKTNCSFDYIKRTCEVALTTTDEYDKVLEKYKDTYDLLKQPPAISQITYTKRPSVQVYIKGGSTVSNFFGGTYFEAEVSEAVDSPDDLIDKYHFSFLKSFEEINIESINRPSFDIGGAYLGRDGEWVGENYTIRLEDVSGYNISRIYGSAVEYESMPYTANYEELPTDKPFIKVGTTDLYELVQTDSTTIKLRAMKDNEVVVIFTYQDGNWYGTGVDAQASAYYTAHKQAPENSYCLFLQAPDTSYMSIRWAQFTEGEEKTAKIYGNFILVNLTNKYEQYTNLGTLTYDYYSRVLCDILKFTQDGSEKDTYELTNDDFAKLDSTYKRCIGLSNGNIYIGQATSDEPTKFGQADNKKYFTDKLPGLDTSGIKRVLPVCRSTWANTSLWWSFGVQEIYDLWEKDFSKDIILKDSFSIGAVIKALLKQIDPYLQHEETEEYSQFLYANNSPVFNERFYIYLTQKTNILKGEYDQAAQKAEITFEELMDMLSKCFRCYWYIEDGKFKLEHLAFFRNGGSYVETPGIQYDFTTMKDCYTGLPLGKYQASLAYDVSDLTARYEFDWADNSTELFSGVTIDVKSNYIKQDKTEAISPAKFSSDIDLMLLNPSDFSNEGFALLCPEKSNGILKLPVVPVENILDANGNVFDATLQNWFASWGYLHSLYFYDAPAENLISSTRGEIQAAVIKKCMKQTISIQSVDDPNTLKVVRTFFGDGVINSINIDLVTRKAEIELLYEPI